MTMRFFKVILPTCTAVNSLLFGGVWAAILRFCGVYGALSLVFYVDLVSPFPALAKNALVVVEWS
jgi:hypothetical protein